MDGSPPEALIQRLAHENGLDPAALLGRPLPSGFTDGYRIVADHPPRESQPLLGQVTALQINAPMRWGNSLVQLSNAIELAATHGIARIFAPDFWWVAPLREKPPGPVTVHPAPAPPDELLLEGRFYYRHSLLGLYRGKGKYIDDFRRNLLQVREQIPLLQPRDPLADDHLVIHIRSGDIFQGQGHPLYGQPPLAFYTLVMRSMPWKRATLVCEDRLNPVVDALLALGGKQLPPIEYRAAGLEEDLDVLLRARTLVSSMGTFVPAVLALSGNVRRLFCFERLWYGDTLPQRLDVRVVRDAGGTYSRSVMARNWRNSAAQRAMMLDYPERNLRLFQTGRRWQD